MPRLFKNVVFVSHHPLRAITTAMSESISATRDHKGSRASYKRLSVVTPSISCGTTGLGPFYELSIEKARDEQHAGKQRKVDNGIHRPMCGRSAFMKSQLNRDTDPHWPTANAPGPKGRALHYSLRFFVQNRIKVKDYPDRCGFNRAVGTDDRRDLHEAPPVPSFRVGLREHHRRDSRQRRLVDGGGVVEQ